MYFLHFFHIFGDSGGNRKCFLWNKEVCLGYCIVFLLHDFKSCNKKGQKKVKEIIVLIKARSFLDELNLEHLTS